MRIRMLLDRRALDQTIAQLLILMVSLGALSLALSIVFPVMDQYNSRNRIREAEALMVSLYNEMVKVQEEPAGSRRTLELGINQGGIELVNNPPGIVCYVRVSKRVDLDIQGMDFAYTASGAMLRKRLTMPLVKRVFIGPGSNLVTITKTDDRRMNVTVEIYM